MAPSPKGVTDTQITILFLQKFTSLFFLKLHIINIEKHSCFSLINQISIHGGTKDTKNLDILVKDDINIFLNNNCNKENLTSEIKLKENLIAPIKKGSVIGEISYTVDEKIYSSDLIAGNDVEIIDFMPIFLRISILLFVIFIIIIVLKRS